MMDSPGRAPEGADAEWRELVERLYRLAAKGMRLGLEPVVRALERLGHPERCFRSIHVAGSNGKGSTCAFAASILAASGRSVGLYTSPHLESLTERVQISRGGIFRPVAERDFARAMARVEAIDPELATLTFFEVITAAGLLLLAEHPVDAGVIEAGLGARLDATRLVDAKVAVLTDLALEHCSILGDSLEAIAREKAAVIRPGMPLVVADGPRAVMDVIEAAAREAGSEVTVLGRELRARQDHEEGGLRFELVGRTLRGVRLSLRGPHQVRNALLGAQAALSFDPTIEDDDVLRGLAATAWPGRLEVFNPPGSVAIVLDGAHNPSAMRALVGAIASDPELEEEPLHVVFGAMEDKDVAGMLEAIAPCAASIVLTRVDSPRAADPRALAQAVPPSSRERVTTTDDVDEAIRVATERAKRSGGLVLVCGSLYLVGAARSKLASGF